MSKIIICEGESEVIFINSLIKNKICSSDFIVKKLKSLGSLKRLGTIYRTKEIIYFIHDTDDLEKIKGAINDAKLVLKKQLKLLLNNPNLDFLIAEMSGIYKKDHKQVLRELQTKYNKSKKITYDEILKKGGSFKNIKNKDNFNILDIINVCQI